MSDDRSVWPGEDGGSPSDSADPDRPAQGPDSAPSAGLFNGNSVQDGDLPSSDGPDLAAPLTVEDLIESLENVTTERDRHLEQLQRLQAEFENFRRRGRQDSEQKIAEGTGRLAEALLAVLDACDAAIGQGVPEIEPVRSSLTLALEKEGLEAMTAVGELFDPNLHEAVLHEAGDGTESVVVDELRAGYRWRGRVLRPAMVKVRG